MNLSQIESGIEPKLPQPRRVCTCGDSECNLAQEYIALRKEELPLEEKLMAVYSKAMTHLDDFRPRRIPGATQEFITDHQEYKKADREDKPSAWKAILEKHKGYLKTVDDLVCENKSNVYFLNEMKNFFEEHSMQVHVDKIQSMLTRHEEIKYEG